MNLRQNIKLLKEGYNIMKSLFLHKIFFLIFYKYIKLIFSYYVFPECYLIFLNLKMIMVIELIYKHFCKHLFYLIRSILKILIFIFFVKFYNLL